MTSERAHDADVPVQSLLREKQCHRDTILAKMISEMRGADLIVFRINSIRNIRNLMRVYFIRINENRNGDVEHMRAFCRYTRKRIEPTHGDVLNVHTEVSSCQAAPYTDNTPHTTHCTPTPAPTPHITTQHSTPQHQNTKRTSHVHSQHTHSQHTRTTISTHTHSTRHIHIHTPPSHHTCHTTHNAQTPHKNHTPTTDNQP